MSKLRVGNKANAILNGEWGKHVRVFRKHLTARIRRSRQRKVTLKALDEMYS